jgi:hypothetical protein
MSGKWWVKKELAFLKKNWGILSGPEIADKLNRTEESVYCKASELELRVKDRQGVSCREAEDISGFNKGTILKAMIDSGVSEGEWKRLSPCKIKKIAESFMEYENMNSVCSRYNLTKYELKKIMDYCKVNNYSSSRVMKLKSSEIDDAIQKYKRIFDK